MTNETRQSEIKGFMKAQNDQKGIRMSTLNTKTKVLVETDRFIYEITPLDSGKFLVESGSAAPKGERVCNSIDSHYIPLKLDMPDWIGKGMRMILRYTGGASVLTGEVRSATIAGNGFSYDMWK